MKKVRYLAGLAGLAPAAAGVMTGTAAHAAPAGGVPSHGGPVLAKTAKSVSSHHLTARGAAADPAYSCFDPDGGYYAHCNAPVIHGPLPTSVGTMHDGDRVRVVCWITGPQPVHGDKYFDELNKEDSLNGKPGPYSYITYVPDYYINFSGLYPNSVPLRHC